MADNSRQLAVVTGASSGIGLSLAKQFARHGFDVMMVAENREIVEAADHIAAMGCRVVPVQVDLASSDGVAELFGMINDHAQPVEALALNAGVGAGGPFVDTPWDDDRRLLELNVVSTVHLAKLVLPSMVARRSGRVLITASVQSAMPGPFYATYAASKAFVLSFAESIRHELKPRGVTVTALLPGPTDTNFFRRAHIERTRVGQGPKDDPDKVAKDGFQAMMAGDERVVAGSLKNKLQTTGARLMPERAKAAISARLLKRKRVPVHHR